ncbi:MFS transporter [Microbacterium timonense]|uniref:MFS transporter n=1 Tax=Microbacterium timonense TaxID=2086576 RepID=UPI000D108FF0|nr:MFS transporter [Microbacterium timonense]
MSSPRIAAPRSTRVVFALLAVAAATFAALQSLITPALPTIQEDLGATQAGISWVLISWLLSASVATPILGRVGDIIGKDRTLFVVLAAIAVGSLVAALAPSLAVLIAGRVIQGLGGAIYPVAFGIIRDEYTRERVPSAVGAMSSVIAVGGGIGTVLAGPIVSFLGWRWLFGIPLIVVTVVALLSWRFTPPSPVPAGGRINWLASVLLASWLVALLLPVSVGSQWGWTSPLTLGLLALAAVLLVVWVVYESRSRNPLIDMRMMRRRAVWATNAVALLFGAAMFSVITFLPQVLQTPTATGYGFGTSVTVAGLLILPLLAAMAVGGLVSGPIHHAIGFRMQLVLGSGLLAAGTLGFALWNAAAWEVAVSGAVFGLGLGLAYAAMTSVIVQAVPPSQTGVATGVNTNVRNIGGAIGTAVFTGIITSTAGASGYPTAGGYSVAFLMLTAFGLLGLIVALVIPRSLTPVRRTSSGSGPQTGEERVVTAPVNVWSAADDDWQ